MNLPPPSPTSGPDFNPLATCRELSQLFTLAFGGPEIPLKPFRRLCTILIGLSENPELAFPLFYPPEAPTEILREGQLPKNPTEADSDLKSFFDSISQ